MPLPYFPNPISDLLSLIMPGGCQKDPDSLCAKLEMRHLDCVEAYGFHKGKSMCADYIYDMVECRNGVFQRARAYEIRKQRMKLYREGKLKQPFEEHPPLDSYMYF